MIAGMRSAHGLRNEITASKRCYMNRPRKQFQLYSCKFLQLSEVYLFRWGSRGQEKRAALERFGARHATGPSLAYAKWKDSCAADREGRK